MYRYFKQESVSSGTPQREVPAASSADGEVDLDGSYLETIEKKKPTPKRTSTPDRATLEELRCAHRLHLVTPNNANMPQISKNRLV